LHLKYLKTEIFLKYVGEYFTTQKIGFYISAMYFGTQLAEIL